MKLPLVFFIPLSLILLPACGNFIEPTVQKESLITSSATFINKPPVTNVPSITPFPTLPRQPTKKPIPTKTITLTPTLNPTQHTWLSTAVSIQQTKKATTQQSMELISTGIAEFPDTGCSESTVYSEISPDGEWIASSCGSKSDQTLIVQNKEGVKWVLEFNDFLHPNHSNTGIPGGLTTLFWDSEGKYLYFTTSLGWSGGGNLWFPGYGTNGLFRINLRTGSWVTLINPPEYFPGDEIKFSPTGRRYATNINDIMVTDINTGEVIQIDASGVIEFIWSPDGTKLAYSISRCNEEGFVIDSSLYVWDALVNESHLILTIDRILLSPISWDEISMLRISGEEYIDRNTSYTLYEYDITQNELMFIGPYSLLP